MSAPGERRRPAVWVSVIDPETPDGRLAITEWDKKKPFQWAVPADAGEGDLVLGWVARGTGFAYLLKIDEPPRKAADDEFGPQQARLGVVDRIQPSVPITRLKADLILRSWWLVRYSMQGVVRAQKESLTQDQEWDAFLRLLGSVAPKVAATLRGGPNGPAVTETGVTAEADAAVVTVSLLDEGSTDAERLTMTRALGDVLARASAINEKRSSFDLSFSSLLLALVYGDDPLGRWLADYFKQQGVKIEHSLAKVRKDSAAAQAAASRGMAERQSILASPLRRSVSARQAFEEASRIAGAHRARHIDAPHLVAAVIALSDYHEQDFGALALDRPRWGAAFVQHMARQARDAAEVEFWRRFYSRRFPGHELPALEPLERPSHRPDYDADAYTSRDLLSIEDEVSALAYVIAAEQTRPPLAIGLFGDWGSGKTFFMKHLRKRIDLLCAGARAQKPSDRVCHAYIAQIEFNAWHYQEGDLWASLVDHMLRNLRFGEDEDEARVNERRDRMVRELDATEARQAAAAARATQADERVGKAEQRVAELQQEEQNRRDELAQQLTPGRILTAARAGISLNADLRREGEALAQELGFPALQRDAVALQDALREARRELAGVWAFMVPLFRAEDRSRRVVLLGVALAVPVALGFAINSLLSQHELLAKVVSAVVGLGSFLGVATKWIGRQTEWVREVRARVEPVAREVDRAVDEGVEAALVEQKKAVADKLAELDALKQEQAKAQKERDVAAAQAAALRTTLATLGDDGLMRAFLDDRIGGGVYQQKLGIAALVRRDFERLSRKIEQVTERERKDGLKAGELVVNRIVLYIDDLDRCEMNKVVPVLRAVHLLLAFPAFVVVVGVDSRWIARCLEKHVPDIFVDDQSDTQPGVTPLDYLEKIFQIPIWLEPVPPERRVYMVRELLRKSAMPSAGGAAPQPTVPEDASGKPAVSPEILPDQAKAPAPEAAAPMTSAPPATTPPHVVATPPTGHRVAEEPALDLNPRGLDITDGEYEFLGQLGGLLSSSPRAIKRFVNTYRLLNVALAQSGVQDEDLRPRDSEVRMLLLAVLVGMPDLSRWLQAALRDPEAENPALTPLVDVMATSRVRGAPHAVGESARGRAISQWDGVLQWIEERGEPWRTMPAARVRQWLDPVGRYTFNLTRSTTAGASLSSDREGTQGARRRNGDEMTAPPSLPLPPAAPSPPPPTARPAN